MTGQHFLAQVNGNSWSVFQSEDHRYEGVVVDYLVTWQGRAGVPEHRSRREWFDAAIQCQTEIYQLTEEQAGALLTIASTIPRQLDEWGFNPVWQRAIVRWFELNQPPRIKE